MASSWTFPLCALRAVVPLRACLLVVAVLLSKPQAQPQPIKSVRNNGNKRQRWD